MGSCRRSYASTPLTNQTAANFEELGGNDKKGFLVGGISAGGNFAAIVSHLYQDENLSPKLTGSYLSIPACTPEALVPEKYKAVFLSREQTMSIPILNKDAMQLFERKTTHSHLSQRCLIANLTRQLQPGYVLAFGTPNRVQISYRPSTHIFSNMRHGSTS